MTRRDADTDWVAEWQDFDGTWTRIAGPGPFAPTIAELRRWKERWPGATPPETRMTKDRSDR